MKDKTKRCSYCGNLYDPICSRCLSELQIEEVKKAVVSAAIHFVCPLGHVSSATAVIDLCHKIRDRDIIKVYCSKCGEWYILTFNNSQGA